MYLLIIETKYNIIRWEVDDIDSEIVRQVLSMPYVIRYKIEKIGKERVLKK